MISCWLCSCGSSHSSGDITMTPPLHRNCPQTIRSECACKVVATELDHAQLFEQQNCHSFKLASEPKIQLPWRLCPAALHFTSTLCAWHHRFGNVVFVGKTPITQGWGRQTLPLACMFSLFFTRHSGMATFFGLAAQVLPSWLCLSTPVVLGTLLSPLQWTTYFCLLALQSYVVTVDDQKRFQEKSNFSRVFRGIPTSRLGFLELK